MEGESLTICVVANLIYNLKISCLLFISILIFAVFWNIFWPGYAAGDGLEDFREMNLTEVWKARIDEYLAKESD